MCELTTTLCDLSKKEIAKHYDTLDAELSSPRYFCRKCARAASTKRLLCKPRKLGRKS